MVIFVNNELQDIYRDIVGNIKSAVLLNGVENIVNRKVNERQQDYFQILHIGGIEPRKGQETLVDAYLSLPPEIKEKMRLVFVGKISDQNKYFRKIKNKTQGEKNICFKEQVFPEEVMNIYECSDLYVCTSIMEACPLTVLEAMRSMVPVISTKVGAMPKIIKDKENGFLIDKEKPDQLAEAILYFYNLSASKKEKIKANAYRVFSEKLSLGQCAGGFLKIAEEF